MLPMADPMIALLGLQHTLDRRPPVDPRELDAGYAKMYDERPNGGRRFSYAKIIDGEVQVVSIFGLERPIEGITCYNVGYAVSEKFRGKGLAIEAVCKGLEDLKEKLSLEMLERFYVEAVIENTNTPSIKVAEKLFSTKGQPIVETFSGKPSLHFKKLVAIK